MAPPKKQPQESLISQAAGAISGALTGAAEQAATGLDRALTAVGAEAAAEEEQEEEPRILGFVQEYFQKKHAEAQREEAAAAQAQAEQAAQARAQAEQQAEQQAQTEQQQAALDLAKAKAQNPAIGATFKELAAPAKLGTTRSYQKITNETPGAQYPPQQLDQLSAAKRMGMEALRLEADAKIAGGEARAKIQEGQAENIEAAATARAGLAARELAAFSDFKEQAAEIDDQIKKHAVDANRVFSGPGGIAKAIMLTLAAAAKGFVMAYRGQAGPNPILKMMDRLVERDIAQQQAELSKLKSGKKDQLTMYNLARQAYGTEEAAQLAIKKMVNEQAIARMQALASRTGSNTLAARLKGSIAALGEKNTRDTMKLYDTMQGKKTTRTVSGSQTRIGTRAEQIGQVFKGIAKKAGKGVERPELTAVKDVLLQLDKIHDLRSWLTARPGYLGGVARIPLTDQEYIRQTYVRPIALSELRKTQKGALTDRDMSEGMKPYDAVIMKGPELSRRMGVLAKSATKDLLRQLALARAAGFDVEALMPFVRPYVKGKIPTVGIAPPPPGAGNRVTARPAPRPQIRAQR